MKQITKQWLKKKDACIEGVQWFDDQEETDSIKVINKLMKEDNFSWANWTLSELFNRKQRIQYAVYAAKQVLPIFEKEYPEDKRPRKAIEAAIKCIDNNTQKNRDVAWDAWVAAGYVARAAWAAGDVAWAAWDAGYAAGAAARDAARAAAGAARDARAAAWDAGYAAGDAMQKKIIKYGIKLLKERI